MLERQNKHEQLPSRIGFRASTTNLTDERITEGSDRIRDVVDEFKDGVDKSQNKVQLGQCFVVSLVHDGLLGQLERFKGDLLVREGSVLEGSR